MTGRQKLPRPATARYLIYRVAGQDFLPYWCPLQYSASALAAMLESPLPEGPEGNLTVTIGHNRTGRNFGRNYCPARNPTSCTDYGYTLRCCLHCSCHYCIRHSFSFDFAPFCVLNMLFI